MGAGVWGRWGDISGSEAETVLAAPLWRGPAGRRCGRVGRRWGCGCGCWSSGWVGMGLGVKTPCGGCAGAAWVVNAAGAVLCRCCGGGCGAHLGGVLGALRGSGLACPWVVLGVCWDGGRRCPGWPVRACGEAVKTLLRSWQPVGVLAWAKSSRSRVMGQAPRRMPCACLVGGAGAWWLDEGRLTWRADGVSPNG